MPGGVGANEAGMAQSRLAPRPAPAALEANPTRKVRSAREAVLAHQSITTGAGGVGTAARDLSRPPYLPYLVRTRPQTPSPRRHLRLSSPLLPPHSRPAPSSVAHACPCVRGEGWERQVGLACAGMGPVGFTCASPRLLRAVEVRAARAAASGDSAEPRGALRRGGRARPRPRRGMGASGRVS